MRMCLTSDLGGYYTGAIEEDRDQFGLKGDFVTSPEISQVFGELIGIWFVTEWLAQGKPKQGVELIEVGPGGGARGGGGGRGGGGAPAGGPGARGRGGDGAD